MNKKLIAILTLVMFAVTLLPMGAFASTNTTVGAIPLISSTGPTTVADLRIEEDTVGDFTTGDTIIFTLPVGVEFKSPLDGFSVTSNAQTMVEGTHYTVDRSSARVVTFELLEWTETTSTKGTLRFDFGTLDVKTVGTGNVNVNLRAPGTAITEGDFTIARFTEADVEISMLSVPTSGIDGNFGTIRMIESAQGAFSSGDTFTMRLVGDFSWDPDKTVFSGTRGLEVQLTGASSGNKIGEFTVTNASSGGPGIIDFNVPVKIGPNANFGDIEVVFGGELDGRITIGRYADFGVTVSAAAPKNLIAAKDDQEFAKVTIEDVVENSLINGRRIVMELPANTRFADGELPTVTAINADIDGTVALSNSGRTITFTVDTTQNAKAKFELTGRIDVAPRFAGEVSLNVRGTAGATGDVVIANVDAPLAIEATNTNIQIGKQDQELANVYLTEVKREILQADEDIRLSLDGGLRFSATPTVEVVEGDVIIDDVSLDDGVVVITIDAQSTVASKLRVSGLKVTTTRAVPEGLVGMTVAGDAVVLNSFSKDWDVTKNLGKFTIATVVTPAVEGTVQEVVMTVGSTIYTVAGVEMAMDVAPYIKNGRTFFPVRFVSEAVGVATDNVLWDGPSNTVTIFRHNRIVQMTIGSTTMLVNGVPLTMDVAPEITASRTMLPIRFLGQGLGINVTWDAATQTVTLN